MRLHRPWNEGGRREAAGVGLTIGYLWFTTQPEPIWARIVVTAVVLPVGLWLFRFHEWELRTGR